jgi:predicted DNA-binding transcriptional regulator AlpA
VTNALSNLPPEIARHRVIGTADSAAFAGFSTVHWRRLYKAGLAPKPVQLGGRKLGWRVGDLIDWLASHKREAA